jgi:predicted nucleic acid-binding protein
MARYPELGFVDVSLVAVSERLKISAIATTDRRHFSRIRPKHTAAFRLLP